MTDLKRRRLLKGAGASVLAGSLPLTLVEVALGSQQESFSFAYISDAHIEQVKGAGFVRDRDLGLIRAVEETNRLDPKPDFVVFGGDLAQLGRPAELDHGAEILSALDCPAWCVMGEHDYYLDLGEHWSRLFGPRYYSFDHKGVHFVVLNSILTYDEWTFDRWPTAEQRMLAMTGLTSPDGSPFMVGDRQRDWLKQDLAKLRTDTPLVVLSHAPLQKIFRAWNFWTEDAEQVQDLLKPFDKVTVLYGHVHQVQHNRIGNISFQSVPATAWPWPHPKGYAQLPGYLPRLTVDMSPADPMHGRHLTGWQLIDIADGQVARSWNQYDDEQRGAGFSPESDDPA